MPHRTAVALACLLAAVALAGCGGDDNGPVYQVIDGGLVRAMPAFEDLERAVGFEVVPLPGEVAGDPLQRVEANLSGGQPSLTAVYGPSFEEATAVFLQRPQREDASPLPPGDDLAIMGTDVRRVGSVPQVQFWWEDCDLLLSLAGWGVAEDRLLEAVEELVERCPAPERVGRWTGTKATPARPLSVEHRSEVSTHGITSQRS